MSTIVVGYDASGNQNAWTANNIDNDTTSTTTDIFVDVPTPWGTDTGAGGEVRGNYATLNPLDKSSGGTLANGNLNYTIADNNGIRSTYFLNSGKWYWEVEYISGIALSQFGIASPSWSLTSGMDTPSPSSSAYCIYVGRYAYPGATDMFGSNWVVGDKVQIAYDPDGGKLWFGRNNTWYNSGNPAAGTNPTFSSVPAGWSPSAGVAASGFGGALAFNFGQRPFAYTAPSGFKALCTQNLPDPTIADGGNYFNTVLYTGNGSTQSITGVGFQPDWVWFKRRSASASHVLVDVLRGNTKNLFSNLTDAEQTQTEYLTSFNADGFSLGDNNPIGTGDNNVSGATYVAWNWKAGGTGVSNTAGTITSTVSANTTAGFSISTYTGNGSSSQTVGHGLGVALGMVIIKTRSNSDNWRVWHTSLTSGQTLTLNSTAAQAASGFWPSNPSTSVVYLGTDSSVNSSTWTYVMYSFAPVKGYSAFGNYVGNNVADGPFVFCGFRPRYVLIKRAIAPSGYTGNWRIFDTARLTYNVDNLSLLANSTDAEQTNDAIDVLSNGFKIRVTNTTGDVNSSDSTYIYAAFAENPFKYALAR